MEEHPKTLPATFFSSALFFCSSVGSGLGMLGDGAEVDRAEEVLEVAAAVFYREKVV